MPPPYQPPSNSINNSVAPTSFIEANANCQDLSESFRSLYKSVFDSSQGENKSNFTETNFMKFFFLRSHALVLFVLMNTNNKRKEKKKPEKNTNPKCFQVICPQNMILMISEYEFSQQVGCQLSMYL